jgi:hypothetical protein
MDWKKIALIAIVTSSFLIIWLGRYELVTANSGGEGVNGPVYKLDRWTGEVKFIIGIMTGDLSERQP